MAGIAYYYVEGFYQKKDGRGTTWRRIKISDVDDKIRKPAQNYNCFATVQRFKNAIEEKGEQQICDLYFDLDGKVEDSQADARRIVDYFGTMGIGKEAVRIWFSGKKGFHVLVSHYVLGAQPHPQLTYIYKRAAHFVAHTLDIKTFDHRVYSIKRMLRLPQSLHRDTGKFKIELSRQDLDKPLSDIIEKASQPGESIWDASDVDDLAVNDTASVWFAQFLEGYEHETNLEKLRPRSPIKVLGDHPVCVKHILSQNFIDVPGNGNKVALALASYCKDKGQTDKQTLGTLEPWVTSLTNTSTASKPREAVASIRSVVHSVFDQPDKYRFACAFIRATGNTDKPVPCLGDACPHIDPGSQETDDPIDIHLSQASRAEFVGKKLKIKAMIAGKDQAPYIVPRKFDVECAADDEGKFCTGCPAVTYGGKFEIEFKPTDDGLIAMCKTTREQKLGVMKRKAKIPQTCKRFRIRILDLVNVEEVRLIPQLDFSETNINEYAVRLGFYIGHGIKTNQRYEIIGYTIPDPTTQYAVETFEDARPSEDNIQTFDPVSKVLAQLQVFQPGKNQSIDEKMAEIHADLEANVTRIHRRSLMAMSLDLIYHTVLAFNFNGQYVHKGWGELLIIGDSGQAKSTLLQKIRSHYQAGEILNGESASRTGLLYTLTESARRWFLVWGRIPLNDMSLLVIDEASGLSHDDIAQLSGPRASGVAEVNRVGISAQTPCRTRLIFSSNPRPGKPLRQYQWPVLAVCGWRELIEKAEDVRRFDFAVAVKSGDVDPDIMNRSEFPAVPHTYTSYLCNLLIRWAWSRKSHHTEFTTEATEEILKTASQFARTYHSSIPLVEPADQRLKIARISAAVAARMFSTDESMEKVMVTKAHVVFAVGIMMSCFHTLGYDKFSLQMIEDTVIDEKRADEILEGFKRLPRYLELAKALLRFKERPFSKMALQEQMDYDRDQVKACIHFLSKNGMIEYTSHGYIKREYFIELLNELLMGRKQPTEHDEQEPVRTKYYYDGPQKQDLPYADD